MTLALLALALGCKGELAVGGSDDSDTVANSDLVGRTWEANGRTAVWLVPATDDAPPFEPILLAVARDRGASIDLRMAVGHDTHAGDPVQDPKRVTATLADVSLASDGSFVFGPEDVTFTGTGASLIFEHFTLVGTFAADRSRIVGLEATGRLDVSGCLELLGSFNVDGACDYVAGWEAECIACGDGGMRCVQFDVQVPDSPVVPGVTLAEVTSGPLCVGVLVLPVGGMFLRRRKAAA